MSDGINTPYVKQYDTYGELLNPLDGQNLYHTFPNRKARRDAIIRKFGRQYSNKKGIQLVISQIGNYRFAKFQKKLVDVMHGKKIVGRKVETIDRTKTK